jgi:putative ABC transport system permease protein
MATYYDDLGYLRDVPIRYLVLIVVSVPLTATAAGWLLAGREPSAITRKCHRMSGRSGEPRSLLSRTLSGSAGGDPPDHRWNRSSPSGGAFVHSSPLTFRFRVQPPG